MSKAVPVREDLFDEKDGGRLHANQCENCGRMFFPKVSFCFDCLAREMSDIILSRRGILYSYAIGRMPSTHFQPPYAVGLVDLPEGVRVFAPLVMTQNETYTIGMEMELLIDELWEEGDKKVIGYKFKSVL